MSCRHARSLCHSPNPLTELRANKGRKMEGKMDQRTRQSPREFAQNSLGLELPTEISSPTMSSVAIQISNEREALSLSGLSNYSSMH